MVALPTTKATTTAPTFLAIFMWRKIIGQPYLEKALVSPPFSVQFLEEVLFRVSGVPNSESLSSLQIPLFLPVQRKSKHQIFLNLLRLQGCLLQNVGKQRNLLVKLHAQLLEKPQSPGFFTPETIESHQTLMVLKPCHRNSTF